MSWAIVERFFVQIVNLLASMVLARVLTPSAYGIVAIVMIFLTFSQVLVDLGLSQSLIANKAKDDKEYSAVFTFNLLISIVIYLAVSLNAGFFADYFSTPALRQVLPVLTISIITNALCIVHRVRLQQALNFKRQAFIQVPGLILSLSVAVIMALKGYGVWSLVAQQLVSQFYGVFAYWRQSNWRPHLTLNKTHLSPHLKYGSFVAITGVFSAIFHHVYDFLIGKYYSKEQLAHYTRAFAVKQLPHENLSIPIINVSFPLFSSLKDNPADLKIKYLKVLGQLCFIVFPVFFFTASSSSEIIRILFGSQWDIAGKFLFWLALSGMFQHVISLSNTLFMLKFKNVKISFILELISKTFFLSGAVLMIPYGVKAMLVFHACFSFCFMIFWMSNVQRFSHINFMHQLRVISIPFVVAFCAAIAPYLIQSETFHTGALVLLAIKGVTFLLIFMGLSILFQRKHLTEFIDMFRLRFSSK